MNRADIRQALDTLGEALAPSERECACRPPKLLLSIKEAAEQLGVGKDTVYGLLDAGHITRIYLTPDLPRIPYRSLEEYVARLELAARGAA